MSERDGKCCMSVILLLCDRCLINYRLHYFASEVALDILGLNHVVLTGSVDIVLE